MRRRKNNYIYTCNTKVIDNLIDLPKVMHRKAHELSSDEYAWYSFQEDQYTIALLLPEPTTQASPSIFVEASYQTIACRYETSVSAPPLFAGSSQDLVVVNNGSYTEVWSKNDFDAHMSEVDFESLTDQLFG